MGTAAASTASSVPTTTMAGVRPLIVPGETITWTVSFAGVEGGRARLAIGQVGGPAGRRLVVVRAEAETAGVATILTQTRDTIDSWIDVDSGLPSRTESTTATSGTPIVVRSERVPGAALARLEIYAPRYGADGLRKAQRLPVVETYDPLSAVLALRGWDGRPGARAVLYSLGGARLWKNVFTVAGREDLDGPLGRRRAIRILGVSTRITPALEDDRKAQPRTYSVWLSDDAQRIPMQIVAHTELGDITARATSYALSPPM